MTLCLCATRPQTNTRNISLLTLYYYSSFQIMPKLTPKASGYLRGLTQDFEPAEMETVYQNLDDGDYLEMVQVAIKIQRERGERGVVG
jgi:hypothetical protein